MEKSMVRMKKDDFRSFVKLLIEKDPRRVIGAKFKRGRFVFDDLDSADELRLDYDVTLNPPKEFFLPPIEDLLEFEISSNMVRSVHDLIPVILIGVHPYDIAAINQLDVVERDGYEDADYLEKREASIIIGVNIINVSSYEFAGSMGTATIDKGYDLMMTDLGDSYAIEIGSEKGRDILGKFGKFTDGDEKTAAEVARIKKEIETKFQKKLNFPASELPDLLSKNWDSPVWEERSKKCFSCGTCCMVCPTCYCFDVLDMVELDLDKGKRVRTWDGCMLEDFAKVGTGENFRKTRTERYRHRFMKKGNYAVKKFGFLGCVGCGRCAMSCLTGIADPVAMYNDLRGATA